jgi:NhaA family Na+:H+ antiporter
MYRVWRFMGDYSLLLVIGAVLGLAWANLDPHSYHAFIDQVLWHGGPIGALETAADGTTHRVLTIHYLVNDILMALFFAIAGKEVWEAVALEGGALRGRKALTPLIATAGGMLGPALVYLAGALVIGQFAHLAHGWAIPTATDIAFSYLIGRIVFGAGHPAVMFLLLLAIADDAGGLLILAVFYPQGDLAPAWLLVSLAAAVGVYLLANRLPREIDARNGDTRSCNLVRDRLSFWPYAIAGAVSWYAFQMAGIHPALGLLPIIPAIPHSDIEFGVFAEEEDALPDLLNRMEHGLKPPVEIVLFLFGLANAGVEFSAIGAATWLVMIGLLIGKPLGITVLGLFAARTLGLGLPPGMNGRDLFVVGCVAAIGFTVALFVAGVAFPAGPIQDAAKMGALFSFAASGVAIVAGILLRVEKRAA